jgi:hypothetical protein
MLPIFGAMSIAIPQTGAGRTNGDHHTVTRNEPEKVTIRVIKMRQMVRSRLRIQQYTYGSIAAPAGYTAEFSVRSAILS